MTNTKGFRGYEASRRYAWYVVLLLTLTQVVSYIDRFLPSLLIQQIKSDLSLTDFQVGLFMGPAFGLFYVFVGVPIGWMADRYSRRKILAAGIAVWCTMTAAAGLARSFMPLFAARLGVGLGEAAVAPCSVSLISDYFERSKRAPAISTFMAGTFTGAGTAFLLGGPVVYALAQMPPISLPLVGELKTWQLAFFVIGLPGLLLSLMMFTIREPQRMDQAKRDIESSGAGDGGATLSSALGYMRKRWRAFGTLFAGSAAVVTLGSLAFWSAAFFERTWGWDVRMVGITTGILFFTGGPIGTLLGIRLTNYWISKGRADATIRTLWVGLVIAVLGFSTFTIMPTIELTIASLFLAFVGQAAAAAAGPSSLTIIAPGQMKSQGVAVYYLCIGIFGQLLGTPPVGLMTDLFGDPAMLRYAMSIEAIVAGSLALIFVALGMRHYRAAAEELDGMIDEPAMLKSHQSKMQT
ncbi:MAG: MFS transporter [Lysobacterales bacterium]